jgi:SWI/SNF-related matrix-associated actin-dependent regulator of chromatin subfamily A member 5
MLELWGLFHWLYPNVFTAASEHIFKRSFDLSQGSYSLPFISAAQQFLSTIMLRRTKASVEADVPPREELTVFIPLTEAQRFWTYRLLTKLDTVDLEDIFCSDLKLEDVNATEGRREVLSHIKNQMQLSRSGSSEGTSECVTWTIGRG